MGKTSKTRRKIRKGGGDSIRECPPDDPIFTRGFVFGGFRRRSTKRSNAGDEKSPPQKAEKPGATVRRCHAQRWSK